MVATNARQRRAQQERIVVDALDQMDGMEWIMVICVGLDTPSGSEGSGTAFADARSLLYRGVTRAHMMVSAVNEFISDGWLAYLTNMRLSENPELDTADAQGLSDADRARLAEQQARRLAIRTAFFLEGECVEIGNTEDIFTGEVKDPRTRDYIEGKFG